MSKEIRVLHVLGGVGLGGAESRIMDLYRQMNREEVQFDFLVHSATLSNCGKNGFLDCAENDTSVRKAEFYDEEIKALGGHIYALPKFKAYNYSAYRRAVRDFFKAHSEFRVVQGHMTSTAGIYLPIAKKSGVPVTIAHSRNAGVEKGLKGIATRFFRRNLVKKADVCFACSELAGEDVFGKAAMQQGKVKIIHNAIDVEKFRYSSQVRERMRDELGVRDKLVLGHVGRFNEQKNHPYLIEIFYELCKLRQDACLLLLGEGPDREAIQRKCESLGLADKVQFLGNQKQPEKYYQAFDIFLLPSFYEGLPGVLVEAQAAGLPCFVSDTVTREAQATELVTYLSIEQPASEWARQIAARADGEDDGFAGQGGCTRRDMYEVMKKAGFDVKAQADAWRIFYLNGDSSLL